METPLVNAESVIDFADWNIIAGRKMPLFFHNLFLFGDEDGRGIWLREHQAEHTQFVTTLAGLAKPRFIPDLDFMSWDNERQFVTLWLDAHEDTHDLLRAATGVAGVNLADVDLFKEVEMYEWLDVHNTEHALLRSALGIS